ncbi:MULTISPECIES: hypothetical protein [Clostridium]|uniref:hypothetical protein n=1 Tax=Clostridium TaxID=1485 RepID=UPI0003FBCAF2|nr:hypothetical protein [Clostridium cadaveris]MDU4952285.1 hypothetical protein [Clostridium sp.]MDY4948162.1 hypothetical protein [Clostridium cadaveris]NME65252.1 hypothetical protein [Clostridium cadaveris]NWK10607.1 hypothetical protein [Clostridium cadaveris]UFH66071.1 hypothetical protein KQH81_05965 [Clostridium cadaveris]
MNAYQLIMKIQRKMQRDPAFSARLNNILNQLNSVPGLQQEVMKIAQIEDERKRQKAMDHLPEQVKHLVNELLTLINN